MAKLDFHKLSEIVINGKIKQVRNINQKENIRTNETTLLKTTNLLIKASKINSFANFNLARLPVIVSVPTIVLLRPTKPTWEIFPKDEFVFGTKAIKAEEADGEEACVPVFCGVNVRSPSDKV